MACHPIVLLAIVVAAATHARGSDCTTSFQQLTAALTTCAPLLPTANTTTDYATFCSSDPGSCLSVVGAALEGVHANCSEQDIANKVEAYRAAVYVVNGVCSRWESQLCGSVFARLPQMGANVTDAMLGVFCEPCVFQYWLDTVAFSQDEEYVKHVSLRSTVCWTDWRARHCGAIYYFIHSNVVPVYRNTSGAVAELCSGECPNRVFAINRFLDPNFIFRQQHCGLDPITGRTCLSVAAELYLLYNLTEQCFTNSTVIPPSCLTAVTSFRAAAGCCSMYVWDMVTAYTAAEQYASAFFPAPCPQLNPRGLLHIELKNVNYSAALANWTAFSKALIKDLNFITGLGNDTVSLGMPTETPEGIAFDALLVPQTLRELEYIIAEANITFRTGQAVFVFSNRLDATKMRRTLLAPIEVDASRVNITRVAEPVSSSSVLSSSSSEDFVSAAAATPLWLAHILLASILILASVFTQHC